jgi:hypothetical protein
MKIECEAIDSKAITMVEVHGSSHFVVDQDVGKGDRRSDGRVMADFFMVEAVERVTKQRILYDPSHGSVGQKSKVGISELADDLLNQLTEDAAITSEDAGIRLEKERVSSKKANERVKGVEITKSRGKPNATCSVVQEQ